MNNKRFHFCDVNADKNWVNIYISELCMRGQKLDKLASISAIYFIFYQFGPIKSITRSYRSKGVQLLFIIIN